MLGGKLTCSSMNTMLKNRRYIGELSFRDTVVPDAIPAIVPKDLFDRVQKRMEKNKRAPARGKADEEYLLTTKLFCGKCGALMFGESGTSATGRTYYYYKCATAKKKKGCNKKTVQKEWLENLVVQETMKLIQDDAVIERIRSAGHGFPKSGEYRDPSAGKTAPGSGPKTGQPDESNRGRLVHPDDQRAFGCAGSAKGLKLTAKIADES